MEYNFLNEFKIMFLLHIYYSGVASFPTFSLISYNNTTPECIIILKLFVPVHLYIRFYIVLNVISYMCKK